MAKKRVVWIDIVKLYACILVVLGHFFMGLVGSNILPSGFCFNLFKNSIYTFHVPLFFICSGYLHQKYTNEKNLNDALNNRLKKLLVLGVPYFFFSTVTWAIKFVFSSISGDKVDSLITSLFVQPLSPYWYLYILFFMFLITPVLNGKKSIYVFVAALIMKILTFFPLNINIYLIDKLLEHEIWFVLGMMLCSFSIPERLKGKLPLIFGILCGALFIGSCFYLLNYGYFFIIGLLACISTIIIAINIQHNKIIIKLSEISSIYTLPVFLMHSIFAAALRTLLIKLGVYLAPIHIILGLIIAIGGPMIAAWIMDKIKYMDFVMYPNKYIKIGKKPKGENNG